MMLPQNVAIIASHGDDGDTSLVPNEVTLRC